MDSVLIAKIVLAIPFALPLVISLIVFLVGGYKRGATRSLLSLGVTVVAAVLAMVLCRLLAAVLPPLPFMEALVESLQEEGGVLASSSLVEQLPQMVGALLMFSPLFLILCIVGKCLCSFVGTIAPQAGWKKAAGMAVRAVDAVIFALVLTLPIYGTVATLLPLAQSGYEAAGELDADSQEAAEVFEEMLEHPVIAIAGKFPLKQLYGGICTLSGDGNSLNLTQVATSGKNIMDQYNAYLSASEEDKAKETAKLVKVLREDLVEQDWGYAVYDEMLAPMLKQELGGATSEHPEAMALAEDFIYMEQAEFEDTFGAVLEFMEVIAEENLDTDEMEQWMDNDAVLSAFGEMLNATDASASLKNYLIVMQTADLLYDGDLTAAMEHTQMITQEGAVEKSLRDAEAKAVADILAAASTEELHDALYAYSQLIGSPYADIFSIM